MRWTEIDKVVANQLPIVNIGKQTILYISKKI